ncbi:MAG: PaaI family thioesterase [Erythrobacter sp.]
MSSDSVRQAPAFNAMEAGKWFFRGGHTGWLGLRYSAHGENWVELELPWREDLLGEPERPVLASGPIVSLMDMASGMSIWQTNKVFVPIATLDLRVDYQRPARERSAVWGRVECYRTTRSAAFVRGIAHDGDRDDPVAHVAGVFMTIGMDPRDKRNATGSSEQSEAGTGDE